MTESLIHVRPVRLLLDVQSCTAQSLKEVLCVVGCQVGLRQWQPGHMAGGGWGRGCFYQTVYVEGSSLALAFRHLQSDFLFFVCCHPERSHFQEPADIRQMVKPCLRSVLRVVHTCCQIGFQIQPE